MPKHIDMIRRIQRGEAAPPPVATLIGFTLAEAEPGRAVVTGVLVAPRRPLAQVSQHIRDSFRHPAGGEANTHMVADARLTRRVDLASRKFRDKHPSLYPRTATYPHQITGVKKLVHPIQNVKIYDAHQLEAAPFRQPGQRWG